MLVSMAMSTSLEAPDLKEEQLEQKLQFSKRIWMVQV